MKPERLKLLNVGPFTGLHEIDFTGLGDIFLVYGKTGAGKTTIFDSLSYVFYGEVPGARKGLTLQMRSQFADDGEQSAVELTFTLGRGRWRVRRTLPYDRAGKRTEKVQRVPEEATLEEWDGAAFVDRSSANKSDTDKAIRDLIGLSAEEFSRIVLLPQGEFAQFLRQKTTERKQVLAKLFPIDDHLAVMETVKNRARETRVRLEEAERAVSALRATYDPDTAARERDTVAERIASLRKEQETGRHELKRLTAEAERSRQHAARLSELAAKKEALAALESERETMEALGRELAAARKAEPVAVRRRNLEEQRRRIGSLREEIARARSDKAETERALAELAREAPAIAEAEAEKKGLLERKQLLQVASDIARELESEQSALRELIAGRNGLATRLDDVRKETKRTADALSGLEPVIAGLEERAAQKDRAQEALERAKRLKQLAEEFEKERLALAAHESAAAGAKKALEETDRDLAIAQAALNDLKTEEARSVSRDSAAALAATLRPGAPCPVCGSIEHPAPAVPAALDPFPLAERLASAQRNLELLEAERRRRTDDWTAKAARKTAAEETAARSVQRYCAESGGGAPSQPGAACIEADQIPTAEAAAETLKTAAAAMQKAVEELTEVNRAVNDQRALALKQKNLAAEAEELRNRLSALERRVTEGETTVRHRTERYREAFPASAGVRSEAVPAPGDAEEALEKCADSIFRLEAAIERHQKETKGQENRLAALAAREETLLASLADGERAAAVLETELGAECAAAGFTDPESALEALRDQAYIASAEGRLDGWNRALAETGSLLERLEEESSRWAGPAPEAAEAAVTELELAIAGRDAELETETAALATQESLAERWAALEGDRVKSSAEALRYDRLYRDLWGNNPQKVPFDAWILGMYLEEIARFANARLERMSDGRYRIRVNDSYRTGNSMAGLELEILDAWTGRSRPAGTLSGGETFMASISLALGLADSIQSRSGGIQLDAVFIDEGFGSLDEASLERAISILDEIRGSRVVGLISHVGELRNRIPNRIEVIKTASGSTIQKETPS